MKLLKWTHLLALIMLAGCAVGPDYQRPDTPLPDSFSKTREWKVAEPADDVGKGPWWEVFGDETLNLLEERTMANSPRAAAALARLDQAAAIARIDRAALLPNIAVNASAVRSRTARDLSSSGNASINEVYTLPLDLGYEIDLWGRVRRSVEASGATAEASAAEYGNLMLSLQAEVARNYLALRTLDSKIEILQKNIALRRESMRIVQSRFNVGATDRLEVARAESALALTESEVFSLKRTRGELENALAVLIGETPGTFSLAAHTATMEVPLTPEGVPSELLERRPDIAAAERSMAASNARIGVARAAFFPTITLFGSAGYASTSIDELTTWDNRTWAVGPSIHLPIFEGGRLIAEHDRSKAAYLENVANYRQVVLSAMREVEDSLLALDLLGEQHQVQFRAVDFARQAVDLSQKRYKVGTIDYSEVLEAQRNVLLAEVIFHDIQGQRLQSAVALIKSIGGDWQVTAKD